VLFVFVFLSLFFVFVSFLPTLICIYKIVILAACPSMAADPDDNEASFITFANFVLIIISKICSFELIEITNINENFGSVIPNFTTRRFQHSWSPVSGP